MTIFLGIITTFFALEVMVEKEKDKREHFAWCFVASLVASLAAMVIKAF